MNGRRDDGSRGPDGSESASSASDRRLKRALREASTAPGGAEVDALKARVLAQWRDLQIGAHRADATTAETGGAVPPRSPRGATVMTPAAQRRRRRLWAGTAGLAAMVALAATAVIVSRPDPALEELMQPDVLSQLAMGEM